jgi:3-isopropylmalate/(R)-2-methylmalate dehydratase small subunit
LAGMAADSMNGLFYRNCISYGFAAMPVAGVSEMFIEGDIAEINYDEGSIRNQRTGEVRYGNRLSKEMMEMIEAGGIEGVLEAKGYIPVS